MQAYAKACDQCLLFCRLERALIQSLNVRILVNNDFYEVRKGYGPLAAGSNESVYIALRSGERGGYGGVYGSASSLTGRLG